MNNNVATTLKVIAIALFVCGFIAGIVFGNQFPRTVVSGTAHRPIIEEAFNWGLMMLSWISALISGVLLLAIAEIIKLLQESVLMAKPAIEELKSTYYTAENYHKR